MNKRVFGKTGLKIPEMGMGCWAIGGVGYGPVSEADALKALETAWENGVRFFDTADTYGEGQSERLVGGFLKNKNRGESFVASKAGWDFYHGGHKKNFDPAYLKFACDESLKRLHTDHIDLYQLHNPSIEILKRGEVFQALLDLKKSGKIRFVGLSLHTVAEALWVLENMQVDSLQVIYNMLDQRMRQEVFPLAYQKQVAVIAREPLACGLLTGKYDAEKEFPKDDHRRRYSRDKRLADCAKIEKIKVALCGEPMAQAALEFVLAESAVSIVIPGAKNESQVLLNLESVLTPTLPMEKMVELKRLFDTDPLFKTYLLPA